MHGIGTYFYAKSGEKLQGLFWDGRLIEIGENVFPKLQSLENDQIARKHEIKHKKGAECCDKDDGKKDSKVHNLLNNFTASARIIK